MSIYDYLGKTVTQMTFLFSIKERQLKFPKADNEERGIRNCGIRVSGTRPEEYNELHI